MKIGTPLRFLRPLRFMQFSASFASFAVHRFAPAARVRGKSFGDHLHLAELLQMRCARPAKDVEDEGAPPVAAARGVGRRRERRPRAITCETRAGPRAGR